MQTNALKLMADDHFWLAGVLYRISDVTFDLDAKSEQALTIEFYNAASEAEGNHDRYKRMVDPAVTFSFFNQ